MLDNSIINPYIRVAMQSVLKKGTVIAKRIIFDYELIYIADGKLVLNYNGTDYSCHKGQFLLICPGISHSFLNMDTDVSQPHIHFDITYLPDSKQVPVCFKDLEDLTDEEKKKIRRNIFEHYPQKPFVTFSDTETVLHLFYKIVTQPKPSSLAQKGLLIELLDMLVTDNFPGLFEESRNALNSIEKLVKDYLDAGQGGSSSLDDIARQFNYSKYYLARRFKKRYGISLMLYRNHRRMQLAKTLLLTENVSAVSEKLGFSSIYVFSRAFKNYFGVSPTDFKTKTLSVQRE